MAWKAFADIDAGGEPLASATPNGLRFCVSAKRHCDATTGCRSGCNTPSCANRPASKTSTIRTQRGLDRSLTTMLVKGQWINDHANLLIRGPSGVRKSWLASAIGNKACRDNRSVLYQRVPRLFSDLALARGDGRHSRLLRTLGRVDLLILDDWGLEPLDVAARHDLLKILEDRYGHHSAIVTSQLPVDQRHALICDPTYADAVIDRRIDLNGESMQRTRKPGRKA